MEQQRIPFWATHTFRRPLETLYFQQLQQSQAVNQQGQPLQQKNHLRKWVGKIVIQYYSRCNARNWTRNISYIAGQLISLTAHEETISWRPFVAIWPSAKALCSCESVVLGQYSAAFLYTQYGFFWVNHLTRKTALSSFKCELETR